MTGACAAPRLQVRTPSHERMDLSSPMRACLTGTTAVRFADCEWKKRAGNVCVASFDWSCSGVCRSVDRMKLIHDACGEDQAALWGVAA